MRNMCRVRHFGIYKTLKWQIVYGSLAKRLATRSLMFGVIISLLLIVQLFCNVDLKPFSEIFDGCECEYHSLLGRILEPFTPSALSYLRLRMCKENVNLTKNVAMELMSRNLLSLDAKSVYIGRGSVEAVVTLHEMGFSHVDFMHGRMFSSLKLKQVFCELDFDDDLFEFVLVRDLNTVSTPALFVSEVERILQPGGVAAVIIGREGRNHDNLTRSVTAVSSFFKHSNMVHVVTLGTFTLVAFQKRVIEIGSYEEYDLPKNCPSIKRNLPFVTNLEPLVEMKPEDSRSRIVSLPSFVNVSSLGKLVFIDMSTKEDANFSDSNWLLPSSYPINSRSFSVYIVDHNISVLSTHVKSPGVTFIYHPALSGSVEDRKNITAEEEQFVGEDEFDFFVWFKETIELADFVVLKMNMGKIEMKFLSDLFDSGEICSVDELFLHCPKSDHRGQSCINVVKSLRNVGVFAHQWWVT